MCTLYLQRAENLPQLFTIGLWGNARFSCRCATVLKRSLRTWLHCIPWRYSTRGALKLILVEFCRIRESPSQSIYFAEVRRVQSWNSHARTCGSNIVRVLHCTNQIRSWSVSCVTLYHSNKVTVQTTIHSSAHSTYNELKTAVFSFPEIDFNSVIFRTHRKACSRLLLCLMHFEVTKL